MKTVPRSRRFGWALLVVAPALFLVSCDSSDSSGPTPASSSPSTTFSSPSNSSSNAAAEACADAAELKSSVQTLSEVEPLQDGLNALEAASADTKAALDTAVASVTAELDPAVEQVRTAFTAVQTAMNGLTADNLADKAPAIATALRGLDTALRSLAATLSQECPDS